MNLAELEAFLSPGRDLGVTDWVRMPQPMLSAFETLTLSNDPLHMDPEWVRQHTTFASTIVPGFLTLSLLPHFVQQLGIAPQGYHALNYGFDRIRWVAPVPVDAELRGHFVSAGVKSRRSGGAGLVVSFDVTVEVRTQERPAMLAQWLGAFVPNSEEAGLS